MPLLTPAVAFNASPGADPLPVPLEPDIEHLRRLGNATLCFALIGQLQLSSSGSLSSAISLLSQFNFLRRRAKQLSGKNLREIIRVVSTRQKTCKTFLYLLLFFHVFFFLLLPYFPRHLTISATDFSAGFSTAVNLPID